MVGTENPNGDIGMSNPPKVIDDAYFAARTKLNEETGCLEWTGTISHFGYGMLKHRQKQYQAHRFHWMYRRGEIPDGLLVCHKCDNRCCVNIDHLFLGTYSDNSQDMLRKGRNTPTLGTRNGVAKLTAAQVAAIRADSRSTYEIGKAFGIAQTHAARIRAGKSWVHTVKEAPPSKRLSINEFARLIGFDERSFYQRVGKEGLGVYEALTKPFKAQGRARCVPLQIDRTMVLA